MRGIVLLSVDAMTPRRIGAFRGGDRYGYEAGLRPLPRPLLVKGGSDVKKALILAAAAGAMLVGSAPPGPAMPGDEGVDYPPCSRSLRDRCIQLHERGVATPENLAINRGDASPDHYAGGPDGDDDIPPPGPYADIDDEHAPPPGMGHHGMRHDGPSEMESVVAPPPGEPVRYAENDYPACADAASDRCVQRRIVVVHRERMLRIGERG
jgi:hypothetical protein